jgi:ubiquinone/menaquinone biosynthesis C-methylase UbiE
MDAERLEFADPTFDVVTCAFAMFLFSDMGQACTRCIGYANRAATLL